MQPELLTSDEELPRESPGSRLRTSVVLGAVLLVAVVLLGSLVAHQQSAPAPTPVPSGSLADKPAPAVAQDVVHFAYAVEGQCPTGFGPHRCRVDFDVPDRFVAAVRRLYPRLRVLWSESLLIFPLERGARGRVYYREFTGQDGPANVFARVLVAHPSDRDQSLVIHGNGDTLAEVQVRLGARVVQVGVDTFGRAPSLATLRALAHDARLV